MKTSERQLVFDKYGGKCAYCGCQLAKGFHVDHIKPILRKNKLIRGFVRFKDTKLPASIREQTAVGATESNWHDHFYYEEDKMVANGCDAPENETIENYNPSCPRCNMWKGTFDIEMFREEIAEQVNRLNLRSANYRLAKDYGQLKETQADVIFYFEKHEPQ